MTIRKLVGAVGKSIAALGVVALATVAFTGVAGATQGNYITPIGTVAAGTPFSSGQTVKVTVPDGTLTSSGLVFPQHQNIVITECAAPNGVLPTVASSSCDQNTSTEQTILPDPHGGVTFSGYTVLALPDSNIGASNITCGNTAATECVLAIGNDTTDFTTPHVFSQPFLVGVGDGTDDGANPGDGTPELPLAIGLPLAAAVIMGGVYFRRRRRVGSSA
jgi:hypothetical protein